MPDKGRHCPCAHPDAVAPQLLELANHANATPCGTARRHRSLNGGDPWAIGQVRTSCKERLEGLSAKAENNIGNEREQEAHRNNCERLKAERLAREAAKSEGK